MNFTRVLALPTSNHLFVLVRDLGAHVDGFIAVVAHTLVLGASPTSKVTGRKADVVLAAHFASQAALRLLRPGNEVCLH